MVTLTKANIGQLDFIHSHLKNNVQVLLPISKKEVSEYIYNDSAIYHDGVIILYRVVHRKTYYGHSLKNSIAIQIDYLVSTIPNKGICAKVFSRFLESNNLEKILLVMVTNTRAVNFYSKQGMHLIKEVPFKTFSSYLFSFKGNT